MPYCVECGEAVDEGYVFCPNCGHEVDAAPPDDAGGGDATGAGTPGSADAGDGTEAQTDDAAGGGDRGATAGNGDAGDASDENPETWGASRNDEAESSSGSASPSSTGSAETDGAASPTSQATSDHAATAGAGASQSVGATAGAAAGTGGPTTNADGPSPFTGGAFSFAAGYAVKDDYDAVIIGAVIEFFGTFIPFVNLMVRGFGFRLATAAARGQTEPPEFGDYGRMFVDGLRLAALLLAWTFGGLILGAILFAVGTAIHEALGVLLLFPFALLVGYLLPASMTAYAAHDSFGAAFSPEYMGAFALTGTYLKAWVLYWVLSVALSVVVLVSMITVIGVFVVVPWSMYVYSSFWGYYYREAVANEEKVPPAPDVAV